LRKILISVMSSSISRPLWIIYTIF
jgi:hypothetical protein